MAQIDAWYALGKGDLSAEVGPGSGAGRIRLKLCYWPLADLKRQFMSPTPSEAAPGSCRSTPQLRLEGPSGSGRSRSVASSPPRGVSRPELLLGGGERAVSSRIWSPPGQAPRRPSWDTIPEAESSAGGCFSEPEEEKEEEEGPPQRGILFLLLVRAIPRAPPLRSV